MLAAYLELMKPRILILLLITGFCAMVVAAGGMPEPWLALRTMIGLALVCGGANAVNMWYDRDMDQIMRRTQKRPLPSGRLQPWQALVFGIACGVAGTLLLGLTVNWLAAAMGLSGYLFYVFIYTMWLKRSTPQNIVIGGAAGSFPPLVGWAAVTGSLGWAPWLMFLIVFLWTPPHFWALALFKDDDYRAAGVPMMPVVAGERSTKWQSLIYAILLVPVSLALFFTGAVGWLYVVPAVLLSLGFVWYSIILLRERFPETRLAKRTFGYSNMYLALIFLAMVAGVSL